jgi:U3 small nucleolar RNA-associated protein 11
MLSRSGPSTRATKGRAWTGTVDGDRGNKALGVDVVRLLKTQDMGYLRTARNVAAKEVKGLEERVIGLGGSLDSQAHDADDDDDDEWDDDDTAQEKPRKVVFVDGVPQLKERLDVEAEDEEEKALDDEESPEKARTEQRQRLLLKLERRLQNSRKKLKALAMAENELEAQRAKMAKTQTIGGITKSGKKFKVRERKR